MAKDVLRDLLSPWHLTAGREGRPDVAQIEGAVVVGHVADGHVGIEELHRLTLRGGHLGLEDGEERRVGEGLTFRFEIRLHASAIGGVCDEMFGFRAAERSKEQEQESCDHGWVCSHNE